MTLAWVTPGRGPADSTEGNLMETAVTHEPDARVTRIENDDTINAGDWYWINLNDDEDFDEERMGPEYIIDAEGWYLMCVAHVGSNFVTVSTCDDNGTHDWNIHIDNWFISVRKEPDWKTFVKGRVDQAAIGIQTNIQLLSDKAAALHLQAENAPRPKNESEQSFLPSTVVKSPDIYKHALVKARDNEFPRITKEIQCQNVDLAIQTRNMFLPDVVKMEQLQKVLGTVKDRLFTIELYVGFQEQVKQIKEGKPAAIEEPIAIRQLLLYMDEETLFDYKSGGMDFGTLERFDKWIVKKKNLCRILPERRGIVAMQVRRHDKDYGPCKTISDAWVAFLKNQENNRSYLLIRNGDNVYRIATDLEFKPRLIPLNDELNKPLTREDRSYNFEKHDYDEESEVITVDDMRYDDYVLKRMTKIKRYNRIILIIQGLIDRTQIFDPMPKVSLSSGATLDTWVRAIRDEEGLPAPSVSIDEYRNQLNKSLRKGKVAVICAAQRAESYGGKSWESAWPALFEIQSMKSDGSAVKVSFPHVYSDRSYQWGRYSDREPGELSGKTSHCYVPIEYVMNATDYNLDDYKMFLCDRAAHGEYLKWAKYLITAEDYKRGAVKVDKDERIDILPQQHRRGW